MVGKTSDIGKSPTSLRAIRKQKDAGLDVFKSDMVSLGEKKEGAGIIDPGKLKSLENKNKNVNIVGSIVDESVTPEQVERLCKAFAYADPEKLQRIADFGVKIRVDDNKALGTGSFNLYNKKVTLSGKDFAIHPLVTHNVNHEVMGHAYLAAKAFGNCPKFIGNTERYVDSIMVAALGTNGIKTDVRDAKPLFKKYRDRVLVDKAVSIKDAALAVLAAPVEKIPAKAVVGLIDKSNLLSDYLNFDEALKQNSAMTKQQALGFIAGFADKAMGMKGVKISQNKNGDIQVKYKDVSQKANGVILKNPILMAAAGVGVGVAAATGAGVLGAGLFASMAAGVLPGPAFYGLGQVTKKFYEDGLGRTKERNVQMDGYDAHVRQKKDEYTITIPISSKQAGSQWTPRGFLSKNLEEYVVEGMAMANKSPEARETLKKKDPEIYKYLVSKELI